MTLVARHAALTDIGLHRTTNEDAFVEAPPLFAVCDGMGGASAGEVASGIAAEVLAREAAGGAPLLPAAEAANAAVFQHANDNVENTGMGTTLTAVRLEGDEGHVVHIGDSRLYLLRRGALTQVTDDHSLVGEMMREGRLTPEEAAVHPHRSVLSRALGTEPRADIDELSVALLPGDVLLLCSDGLSGPVAEDALRRHLARPDPAEAARRLVAEARKHGAPDNVTAVVVRLEEAGGDESRVAPAAEEDTGELPAVEPREPAAGETTAEAEGDEPQAGPDDAPGAAPGAARPEPAAAGGPAPTERRKRRRLIWLAVVLVVVLLVAAAGAYVLTSWYFIGVDDGRLTVYSGLPYDVGPLDLHAVYRRSSLAYSALAPTQRAVVDGHALRSHDNAMALAVQLGMWP